MSWILLLLAVLGTSAVLSGCGNQAQEQEEPSTSKKESAPVPPPSSDMIEIPGNDSPVSSDPKGNDEKSDEYAGWIPFLLPMVYCRAEGWLEYWAPRLYGLGTIDKGKSFEDYVKGAIVYNGEFDNKSSFEYISKEEAERRIATFPKWFIIDTYMEDGTEVKDFLRGEFLNGRDMKLEFISDYLIWKIQDSIRDKFFEKHKKLNPGNPDLAKYIYDLCSNYENFNAIEGTKEAIRPFMKELVEDLHKEGRVLQINPVIILSTFYTERYCGGIYGGENEFYTTCMGIGTAGEAIPQTDPFHGAAQIYLENYAIGYHFFKLGLFDPALYYTSPHDHTKRKKEFINLRNELRDQFIRFGGFWGTRPGADTVKKKYNVTVDNTNDYGPLSNVCAHQGTDSGYKADYINNMLSNDKWAVENENMALFMEGVPFLPGSPALYARLKYNTWLYYPSENIKPYVPIGSFNTQEFYRIVRRTKKEYETWKTGGDWKHEEKTYTPFTY